MANEISVVDIPERAESKRSTFVSRLKELPDGKALSVALNGEKDIERLRMALRSSAEYAGMKVKTAVRGSSVIIWKK